MSIEKLRKEIAISQVSADNENYLIRFTITDGEKVLVEVEQLKAELTEINNENKRLKETIVHFERGITTLPKFRIGAD